MISRAKCNFGRPIIRGAEPLLRALFYYPWRISFDTGGTCYRLQRSAVDLGGNPMNSIIYLVGLVVVVLAILSFVGLR